MSDCTLGVAVAVRATTGISVPIESSIMRIRRYSGRKSCPHSEIQWASSTATKGDFNLLEKLDILFFGQGLRSNKQELRFAIA